MTTEASTPRTCPVCRKMFEDCTCTGTAPLIRRMLAEMASRLETLRPDEPITTIGRHALIQATTMDPVLTPILHRQCPEITAVLLRREYAAQLRVVADGQVVDTSSGGVTRLTWYGGGPR